MLRDENQPRMPPGNQLSNGVSRTNAQKDLPSTSKTAPQTSHQPYQGAVSSTVGSITNPNAPLTEKQLIITKLKGQNEKLKSELKVLTGKLEEFIDKNRQKKLQENRVAPGGGQGGAISLKDTDKDEGIR